MSPHLPLSRPSTTPKNKFLTSVPSNIIFINDGTPYTITKEDAVTTLVIDRKALPEPLLSFIGADRIMVEGEADRIVLTPADESEPEEYDIDPDDYPNTTAYFNAIPGAVDRLLAYRNLPDSEFSDL